jgi:hypothetical protein
VYIAISYHFDRRFGLSEVGDNLFDHIPTTAEVETLADEHAADAVRIYRQDVYGRRILESEFIYHDLLFDDAGEEGEFLYDDV